MLSDMRSVLPGVKINTNNGHYIISYLSTFADAGRITDEESRSLTVLK